MKKLSDPNEKIELVNLLAVFRLEMKKLREQLNKKGYVCRYCGKQDPKPLCGNCPYSPHPNKCNEFIKSYKNTLQPISHRVFDQLLNTKTYIWR